MSQQELRDAEDTIVKDVQGRHFGKEIKDIKELDAEAAHRNFNLSGSSQVKILDLMVDEDEILKVGGRI